MDLGLLEEFRFDWELAGKACPDVRYFCVSTKYLPSGLAGSGR